VPERNKNQFDAKDHMSCRNPIAIGNSHHRDLLLVGFVCRMKLKKDCNNLSNIGPVWQLGMGLMLDYHSVISGRNQVEY
jgi:hypothetical protein